MTLRLSLFPLVLLLLLAAVFVSLTSATLPASVAAHFVAGGVADGYMPRAGYLALMVGLVVGLPLIVALLSSLLRAIPPRHISLPDRDYWLAPERSAGTIAFIAGHGIAFAALLAAFLCFVHWLVVRANAQQPPLFPEHLFTAGLAVFVTLLAVWAGVFVVRFRRRR